MDEIHPREISNFKVVSTRSNVFRIRNNKCGWFTKGDITINSQFLFIFISMYVVVERIGIEHKLLYIILKYYF